ncbi:Spermidine hydroxycinnamoyl transferase [Acorus calamus]|uniref:Spermidine hydroxycinnamoyl transferase n=1 Tax=Acorus calamus TaxID=4465 RepID=A0AAV9FE60_ACOCL|nr:Spermidine hydroxycinnamoyl transferase [Acorus calamus]
MAPSKQGRVAQALRSGPAGASDDSPSRSVLPINGGDKSPPAHREAVLKTSLSRLLASFYPLAGRLRREGPSPHGTASVECTDEGVPFTVAQSDKELESVYKMMNVADGSSWALLLKAWSASARFGTISPQLTPRFTAASIFPPVNPPPPVIVLPSHRKLHPRRFLIGARALERLRSERTVRGARRPTRFEAAAGAVWRCARRAREGLTNLCLIVSLRPRLSPPVRPNVVGNMWVTTATTTEEGIGEAVSGIDGDGVGGYGYYEADFGWGKPRRLGLANHDAGELALFVGTASGEGLEVWVWLEEEVMVRFEKDPEIIGLVSHVGH